MGAASRQLLLASVLGSTALADVVEVEGQPLGENAKRLLTALEYLGASLDKRLADELRTAAKLQMGGYTPVVLKINNSSTATKKLRLSSPQAGALFGGMTELSAERQAQEELLSDKGDSWRSRCSRKHR